VIVIFEIYHKNINRQTPAIQFIDSDGNQKGIPMESKVRFGIIGGGMAGPLHAGALRDIPDAETIAFCDVNEDVAKKFSAEYGIPNWYTDYREMLKRDDIDAVCIATPPFLHEQMVIDCAKAGKHVMCEKPISITCNSADRMIKACDEAGVKFGVIFMYRFMDQAKMIKKALDEGRLGKLLSVDCSGKCFRSDEYYASGAWRGTWKGEGGGSLISQTVHFIDLMLYFCGDVERLFGNYMTTLHPDIEVDDVANAVFKFKNGALGSLVSSSAVRPGYPRHIEIHGEKGTIKIVEEEIVEWKVDGMNEDDFLTKTKTDSGDTTHGAGYVATEYHRRQLTDFIEAIREDRKPMVDGVEGRRTLEFIRAIYQSGDTGKEVAFPVKDDDSYGKKKAW
jgi:UDP-N-acetyl-2-amino-2-deoxyglucuronate dehydrogenase